MYTLPDYGKMVADPVRMQAYRTALESRIEPGSVVVDLGTGTGIFAMIAALSGAGRVYAIEPADSIQVARELAEANGCGNTIEFIRNRSTEVTLPERADIIVSDLRGILPLRGRHIPDIIDARQRFLSPGGTLIPARDILMAALVDSEELWANLVTPWRLHSHGVDMKGVERYTANTQFKARAKPEELLTEPAPWAILDYYTIEDADLQGTVLWTLQRGGTAHGIAVWFDAELTGDISFSNAPDSPELIYGSSFLPLPEAVPLEASDTVSVTISADLIGDDYVWRWKTRIDPGGDRGGAGREFSQSTFYCSPISPEELRKADSGYRPSLGAGGLIDLEILKLMDGERTLQDIALELTGRFPDDFDSVRDALNRVSLLSRKYSET